MPGDKFLWRVVGGGSLGLTVGSVLGACMDVTGDSGLTLVLGGILGLALGVLTALFRTSEW